MPELAGQHVRGCRKPWDLGFMATKDTTKTNPAGEFMKPLSRETTNSFVHQAEDQYSSDINIPGKCVKCL